MKKKTFVQQFKDFAFKGNVVDMAVGVIIGGAFGAIVTALVSNIIMPLVGLLTNGMNFSDLKVVLSPAVVDEGGAVTTPENALMYGLFIEKILYFLIVALSIFIVIKLFERAKTKRAKEEEAPPAAPAASAEVELLGEIRDLLREKK